MADRAALDRISPRHAKRWGVLPLSVDEDVLYVTLADPEDDNAIAQLESHTGLTVKVLPAVDVEAVSAAIRRYYPRRRV